MKKLSLYPPVSPLFFPLPQLSPIQRQAVSQLQLNAGVVRVCVQKREDFLKVTDEKVTEERG